MNKRLIVLAVAGAFASAPAFADMPAGWNVNFSGWGETVFSVTDDFGKDQGADVDGEDANASERKFATQGELDVHAKIGDSLYGRFDLDINNSGADNNVEMEQAFVNWKANDMFGVRIGRFNNPLGYEGQDSPDISTITSSLISSILDGQTSAYSNNIEGVALDLMAGPAKVTVGVLNEIGGVDEANSFLLHASASPIEGLDLGLGILTQEDNTTFNDGSAENLINFNAAYGMNMGGMPFKVWVDYLTAGEIYDSAYSVGGYLMISQMVGVALRYDAVQYTANVDDSTAITAALTVRPVEHLDLMLEWRKDEFDADTFGFEDGTDSADRVQLSAVFTF